MFTYMTTVTGATGARRAHETLTAATVEAPTDHPVSSLKTTTEVAHQAPMIMVTMVQIILRQMKDQKARMATLVIPVTRSR